MQLQCKVLNKELPLVNNRIPIRTLKKNVDMETPTYGAHTLINQCGIKGIIRNIIINDN